MTARALVASLLVAALACERQARDADPDASNASDADAPADTPASAPARELDEPASADRRPRAKAPPVPREPVAVTPIPGADQPGPVYLVLASQGIVRFDEAGARAIGGELERHVQALFVGPDGGVYLVDAARLARLDGDRLVELERFGYDTIAPVEGLSLGPDGTWWAVGGRGAGPRVDGRWQLQTLDALGLGYSARLVVGHDGTAWLVGARRLLRRSAAVQDAGAAGAGGAWAAVSLDPLGRAPLLLHPTASPSGAVLATDGQRLIRLTASAATPELLPLTDAGSTEAYTAGLAIAADGTLALASGDCRLLRFEPDGRGEPWRFGPEPDPGRGYACQTLEAMTVDARGRVWVAAREGLSVLDSRAGGSVEYPAGSFAALAGRVGHMVAVGLGPAALPEVPGALARADLSGTAVLDGKPVAGATIEACPTVALVAEGSPCSRAKVRQVGKTDARGRFTLADVPIGDYSFAVEVGDEWRWSAPPSFAAALQPGHTHALGTVDFTPQ